MSSPSSTPPTPTSNPDKAEADKKAREKQFEEHAKALLLQEAPPPVTPNMMVSVAPGPNPKHDWGNPHEKYKVPKGSNKIGGYRIYASPYALPHTYWIVDRYKWQEEFELARLAAKNKTAPEPKLFNFLIDYPYTEYFWLGNYYIYEYLPTQDLPLVMGELLVGAFSERDALPKRGGSRQIKYLAFKSAAYDPKKNKTYDYYVACELNGLFPDKKYTFAMDLKNKEPTFEELLRTSSSYYDLYNFFINVGKEVKTTYLLGMNVPSSTTGITPPRAFVTPYDIREGDYNPGLWKEFEDELKAVAEDLLGWTEDLLDFGLKLAEEAADKIIGGLLSLLLDNPVLILVLIGGGYLAYEYTQKK